jgi:hypothetical protein
VDTHTPPTVPLPLVEWLERHVLQRLPSPSTDNPAVIAAHLGQMELVRMLRGIYHEQTDPKNRED